ncbi:MAG: PKD domain-containing protein, partial [Saccharospirillaceae bacterium]|nr:PKD domain-containing protein [Pseudomonadales bacterium]NRB81037.1 PKD domain-containing protein [Saccharospirillaceae bacterium]
MSIRNLIISLSVIVGLSSCGSDPEIAEVSEIKVLETTKEPVDTNGTVIFDLSNDIEMSDGIVPIYTWYFEGQSEPTISSVAIVEHSYAINGTYKVVLVITDAMGSNASETIEMFFVIDSANSAGTQGMSADFSFVSNAFDLDFSSSVIGFDGVVSYNWDFGDNQTSMLANPAHTFLAANTYSVVLIVSDSTGNQVVYTRDVFVSAAVNIAPIAKIAQATQTFLSVDVSAVGSRDPEGGDVSYIWNFGDGTIKQTQSTLWLHEYQAAGTYTITLTVSDGELKTTTLQTIQVVANPNAKAPYYSLFEKAYNDFLGYTNGPCANCHYDGPINTSNFSMGTSGSLITMDSAEQGLVDLLKLDGGLDKLSNPIDGANNTHAMLDETNIETWIELTDSMQEFFNRLPNAAPNAVISQSNANGLTVSLSGSGSSDSDGDSLNYAWTFGEGELTAFGENSEYTFITSGTKIITLTVTDRLGGVDVITTTVNVVAANSAPTAVFTFSTDFLSVTFDASASMDADNDDIFYAWDFGDGTVLTKSSVSTVSHTYTLEDTYNVSLTVSDQWGEQTLQKSVTAATTINVAPVSSFIADEKELSVSLISTSQDPDGDDSLLTYVWKVENILVSTDKLHSYVFTTSGNIFIELIVTDSRGDSHSSVQVITVANQAPTASFSISTMQAVATLNASLSSDLENDDLTYLWDFGDNQSGTNAIEIHTYQQSGVYVVTLTVADATNSTVLERIVTIELAAKAAPSSIFTNTNMDEAFTFTATAGADDVVLTYAWDFGDGNFATGIEVTHTFAVNADFTIKLTVTEGELESTRIKVISTKPILPPNILNGEVIYHTQCAICHEGDDNEKFGEGKILVLPIAINRYLDHQANLFEKIENTM